MEAIGPSWDRGSVSTDVVLAEMAARIGRSSQEIESNFDALCRDIQRYPTINSALASRKARGGRQVVVTVKPDCFRKVADVCQLPSMFDLIITSSEIGNDDKVEICSVACRRLGIQPSQSVLVDNIATHVERWRAEAGHGYVFTDDEQFARDLQLDSFQASMPVDPRELSGACSTPPRTRSINLTGPRGRLRTLGDCFNSFEGAQHVAPVATLPQKPAERAPNLREEVVAEIEGLGDIGASVVRGAKLVAPGVHWPVAHHDSELEDLTGHALSDLASSPVEDGPVFISLHVTPIPRADRRTGGAADPLGLDDLGTVLPHLRDVADEPPDLVRRRVDFEIDRCAHVSRP
jgi:hypothetical protein